MHASSWVRVRTLALVLLAAAVGQGLAGCTHAGGKLPVDAPVYAFQPADPEDYADDEAEDTDASGDDASDDSE